MSLKITFEVDSKKWAAQAERIRKAIANGAIPEALERTAVEVIREAKSITPVLTGALRDSLTYEIESTEDSSSARFLSDVEYAIFVHENLDAKHNNGQAKFLEQPMNRATPKLIKHLKAAIARVK